MLQPAGKDALDDDCILAAILQVADEKYAFESLAKAGEIVHLDHHHNQQ